MDDKVSDVVEADPVDIDEITATVEPIGPAAELDVVDAPVERTATGEVTLVSRAQDGDAHAFEQLVRAYQTNLFRLAFRMLSDRGAAEDAVQDTFVTVWRRLPTLQDPQAFRAWVYHIATRRCLSVLRLRKSRRTTVGHGDDLAIQARSDQAPDRNAQPADPATAVQAQAARGGLDLALADLPTDQRACWVLHEMHDLSYEAIAYAIGVPTSTVRGRLSRARQNLMEGMSSWR